VSETGDGPQRIGRAEIRSLVIGATATVVTPLPQFLTGAMAVQMTGDLRFGAGLLGVAIAINRAGQGISSLFLGRLADELGSTRALRLAMWISAFTSVGIATTARNFASLAAWLFVASFAHALSQPASNRLLSRRVRPGRLGTAFGLKQSATPASTMLAGFAVPVFAVGVGWRWAFVATAVMALALVVTLTRRLPPLPGSAVGAAAAGGTNGAARPARNERVRIPFSPFLLLTSVAFGLVLAGNVVVPSFYVGSAVEAGTRVELAGFLLGAASLAAIVTRILSGLACDHLIRRPLLLVAALVAFGGAGILLLATGEPALMNVGVVMAVVGTWGFNAVFWYAIVKAYPQAPGSITGLLSPGGQAGATLGVLSFGFLVERFGYGTSWTIAAITAFVAALAMVAASILLERSPAATGLEGGDGRDGSAG
jgi:predicted MFS family arabinose efflux permease